jgi:hypothetical protein
MEVIFLTFGFIFFPMSEHSFYLKAIKSLFYAKTVNKELFEKEDRSKPEK